MSSTSKRIRRAGGVAALAALACLIGGWTIQSCQETNDPPTVASGCDADFCTAGTGGERCKYGLRNIRHRYFAGLPNGSASEIYFGGQRTSWCWRGSAVTKRKTQFPLGWTSLVGSGSVVHSTYSSNCDNVNFQCLVREDFLARLDATVPGIGITIGINERFCVGTRVVAGGTHHRNISGGSCPGSSGAASAGLAGFSVSPALEARISKLAFSPRNLRRMARTGDPLPALRRMLARAYGQLSPAEKRKLRSSEYCIARLGSTCGKGA